jgi:hypothetical protein
VGGQTVKVPKLLPIIVFAVVTGISLPICTSYVLFGIVGGEIPQREMPLAWLSLLWLLSIPILFWFLFKWTIKRKA